MTAGTAVMNTTVPIPSYSTVLNTNRQKAIFRTKANQAAVTAIKAELLKTGFSLIFLINGLNISFPFSEFGESYRISNFLATSAHKKGANRFRFALFCDFRKRKVISFLQLRRQQRRDRNPVLSP